MLIVEFQCLDSGKAMIVRDLTPAAMVGRSGTVGYGVGAAKILLTYCFVYSLTVAIEALVSYQSVPDWPIQPRHRQDAPRTSGRIPLQGHSQPLRAVCGLVARFPLTGL